MEIQVEIAFEDLLKMVKQLPAYQLEALKTEIEQLQNKSKMSPEEFTAFLQTGPVVTQAELDNLTRGKKGMDKWKVE